MNPLLDTVEPNPSLDECIEIVDSYGPYGFDVNEDFRIKIALKDEVLRLRGLLAECHKEARKEALLEAAKVCDRIASSAGTNAIHCAYELRRMAEGEEE